MLISTLDKLKPIEYYAVDYPILTSLVDIRSLEAARHICQVYDYVTFLSDFFLPETHRPDLSTDNLALLLNQRGLL